MSRSAIPGIEYLRVQLKQRGAPLRIEKIRSEASVRQFFRIHYPDSTCVALVFPQPSKEEIGRICRFTRLYREHGLWAPEILDVIRDRIILQEDAGDTLLQKQFRNLPLQARKKLIGQLAEVLQRLRGIDATKTQARLDRSRMERELDFFCQHVTGFFPGLRSYLQEIVPVLRSLVKEIGSENTFAHRDFHTRNMLQHQGKIYLVDFQDSLVAPPLYDLVSLAFDCYCDLGQLRDQLFAEAARLGLQIDGRQMLMTALQRNIKALGTFSFQITARRNRVYRRYIPRTVGYVVRNLQELNFKPFAPLQRFFSRFSDFLP